MSGRLSLCLSLLFVLVLAGSSAWAVPANGGFESGDLTGWEYTGVASDSGNDYWRVTEGGADVFFPDLVGDLDAVEGDNLALLWFGGVDGDGKVTHTLSQQFSVPVGAEGGALSFSDRVMYTTTLPGAGLPSYHAAVYNAAGAWIADLRADGPEAAGEVSTGAWQPWTWNFGSSYAGQTLEVRFTTTLVNEGVAAPLGQGMIALDDVRWSADVPSATPELPSCALLLCTVAPLAVAGLRVRRRRS